MPRFVARLTIILFALRALLPAGFMPDLGALGAGHLDLVLCTAQPGASAVPNSGAPVAPQKSPGADCPFGTALVKSLLVPVASAVPSAFFPAVIIAPPDSTGGLVPSSQGPPLGSRAPPILTA